MADHPAWQELLKDIPEALHEIVKPVLQKWDQGVQQTLESKTAELKKYEPFKQFVDNNVDPAWLAEAADFAYMFEQNPKETVQRANEAFNLGFNLDDNANPAAQLQQQQLNSGDDPNLFEDDGETMQDITKHPQFAQLMEVVNGLQQNVEQFTSQQEGERQAKEFNQFLAQQHEQHGDFDDNYVTALMANGANFPQALEQYQSLVAGFVSSGEGNNENNENNNNQAGSDDDGAPVVMGGAGNAGNGSEQQPISFGAMKSSDLEDTVANMIAQMNQAG